MCAGVCVSMRECFRHFICDENYIEICFIHKHNGFIKNNYTLYDIHLLIRQHLDHASVYYKCIYNCNVFTSRNKLCIARISMWTENKDISSNLIWKYT
jgi:hypothetical protein